MTTTELPPPSCPHGYTRADLENILGSALPRFNKWMVGQTAMICEAQQYHHDRAHGEYCGHEDGEDFTWKCDYTGTGYYEPSECADNPHGMIVYVSDVYRFVNGLPVID